MEFNAHTDQEAKPILKTSFSSSSSSSSCCDFVDIPISFVSVSPPSNCFYEEDDTSTTYSSDYLTNIFFNGINQNKNEDKTDERIFFLNNKNTPIKEKNEKTLNSTQPRRGDDLLSGSSNSLNYLKNNFIKKIFFCLVCAIFTFLLFIFLRPAKKDIAYHGKSKLSPASLSLSTFSHASSFLPLSFSFRPFPENHFSDFLNSSNSSEVSCDTLQSPPCSLFSYPVNFRSDKLALEDANPKTQNFLFRSGLPLKNLTGQFAYRKVKQAMENRSKDANLKLPEKFLLKVFSLLWNPDGSRVTNKSKDERCDYACEKCFFFLNPLKGNVAHWPLKGIEKSPYDILDIQERNELAEKFDEWDTDKVNEKLEHLHSLIYPKEEKQKDEKKEKKNMEDTENDNEKLPVVILFHCRQGKDRTGELSGAYNMRFKGKSLSQVWNRNQEFHQNVESTINHMMWYCLYLEIKLKIKTAECYNIFEVNPPSKIRFSSYTNNWSNESVEIGAIQKNVNNSENEMRRR